MAVEGVSGDWGQHKGAEEKLQQREWKNENGQWEVQKLKATIRDEGLNRASHRIDKEERKISDLENSQQTWREGKPCTLLTGK